MTKKILVVGYGNLLRRDDGAGIETVEQLRQQIQQPNCDFLTSLQPQPEMVAHMSDADIVIFVDTEIGSDPGEIHQRALKPSQNWRSSGGGGHIISPEWMLWLCEKLYGHTPRAELFTITGYDFDHGEGFSSIVTLRLPELVARIVDYIAQQGVLEAAT